MILVYTFFVTAKISDRYCCPKLDCDARDDAMKNISWYQKNYSIKKNKSEFMSLLQKPLHRRVCGG